MYITYPCQESKIIGLENYSFAYVTNREPMPTVVSEVFIIVNFIAYKLDHWSWLQCPLPGKRKLSTKPPNPFISTLFVNFWNFFDHCSWYVPMFASIQQQLGDIIACLKGDKSFANCEFKSLFQMSQRAANWPIPHYARDDSFIRILTH